MWAVRAAINRSGWTLVELAICLALLALLATLAYPGLRGIVLRIHRSDALTTLAALQLQQSRYRSNHPAFATLAQLGIVATSPGGRYRLQEQAIPSATGFAVMAIAAGAQAADLRCSHLLLEVNGEQTRWASGADATVGNDDSDNRRCWGR
ncbi:type IV pilin protein [Piscinibacter sakaiensis]|uniref:type IV pilin protein n=1 Tax=Piscinibacter sakaiensis TaxID=1547922 RepID=UPI003AAF4CED